MSNSNREKNIKSLIAAGTQDVVDVWVVPGFIEVVNHTQGYRTSFEPTVSDEEVAERILL